MKLPYTNIETPYLLNYRNLYSRIKPVESVRFDGLKNARKFSIRNSILSLGSAASIVSILYMQSGKNETEVNPHEGDPKTSLHINNEVTSPTIIKVEEVLGNLSDIKVENNEIFEKDAQTIYDDRVQGILSKVSKNNEQVKLFENFNQFLSEWPENKEKEIILEKLGHLESAEELFWVSNLFINLKNKKSFTQLLLEIDSIEKISTEINNDRKLKYFAHIVESFNKELKIKGLEGVVGLSILAKVINEAQDGKLSIVVSGTQGDKFIYTLEKNGPLDFIKYINMANLNRSNGDVFRIWRKENPLTPEWETEEIIQQRLAVMYPEKEEQVFIKMLRNLDIEYYQIQDYIRKFTSTKEVNDTDAFSLKGMRTIYSQFTNSPNKANRNFKSHLYEVSKNK